MFVACRKKLLLREAQVLVNQVLSKLFQKKATHACYKHTIFSVQSLLLEASIWLLSLNKINKINISQVVDYM